MLLFFGSELLLTARFPVALLTLLYVATVAAGYISLLTAGTWISRLLKNQLMDDVFNDENESFMQERRLIANEYSVNLPTRFRYQRKTYSGWINVINPFRASLILGTPGSGKSYAIINNYIRQQIEKGFAAYIYDFKYPDLSIIAYNQLLKNKDKYAKPVGFYVINFDDPRYSHRCNPLNPSFLSDIADAYESAYVIMLNLNKSWIQKQGDFFVESPIVLFAAVIWYLKIYENGTNSWSRGINELPARGIRIWLRCLNCPRIGCAGLIRWLCGKISSSIAINAAEPKTVIVPFVGKRSLYPGIHITIRKDAVPAAGIPLYSKPWGAPGIFGQKRTMLI